jgi:hypothetical protein
MLQGEYIVMGPGGFDIFDTLPEASELLEQYPACDLYVKTTEEAELAKVPGGSAPAQSREAEPVVTRVWNVGWYQRIAGLDPLDKGNSGYRADRLIARDTEDGMNSYCDTIEQRGGEVIGVAQTMTPFKMNGGGSALESYVQVSVTYRMPRSKHIEFVQSRYADAVRNEII